MRPIRAHRIAPGPDADLREISRAVGVAREVRDAGLAPIRTDEQIESAVDAAMWSAVYDG